MGALDRPKRITRSSLRASEQAACDLSSSSSPDSDSEATACPRGTWNTRRRATPAPTVEPFTDDEDENEDSQLPSPSPKRVIRPRQTRNFRKRATPAPTVEPFTEDEDEDEESSPEFFVHPQKARSLRKRATPAPTIEDFTDEEGWQSSVENTIATRTRSRAGTSRKFSVDPTVESSGFMDMPNEVQPRYPRRSTRASTNVSVLTELSRSPSPPSDYNDFPERELMEVDIEEEEISFVESVEVDMTDDDFVIDSVEEEVEEEVVVRKRAMNGRFSPKRPRAQTSSRNERPAKRAKTNAYRYPSPFSERSSTVPPMFSEESSPLGTLTKLPQEIRQNIFGLVLDIARPVTNKWCCGPNSTQRERDACSVHGTSVKPNTGRFTILQVSKAIEKEASWVLYNQSSMWLDLSEVTNFRPYVAKYKTKSRTRLGDIPHNKAITDMWMNVARYRFVELYLTSHPLEVEHPEVYLEVVLAASSLLLKGWEKEKLQPTAEVKHSVTINLDTLFEEIVPFNAVPDPDPNDVGLWLSATHLHHLLALTPDFSAILETSVQKLRTLASVIGQHKGNTEWKVVTLGDEDLGARVHDAEPRDEGKTWYRVFEKEFREKGVEWVGLSAEEMERVWREKEGVQADVYVRSEIVWGGRGW